MFLVGMLIVIAVFGVAIWGMAQPSMNTRAWARKERGWYARGYNMATKKVDHDMTNLIDPLVTEINWTELRAKQKMVRGY